MLAQIHGGAKHNIITQYWAKMLGQRRKRWANISPALSQRHVFDHLQDRKRWTDRKDNELSGQR